MTKDKVEIIFGQKLHVSVKKNTLQQYPIINYLGVCHLAPYQLFQMAHQVQGIPLLSGSILQQLDSNTFQFPMETQIYKMTEVDPAGSSHEGQNHLKPFHSLQFIKKESPLANHCGE